MKLKLFYLIKKYWPNLYTLQNKGWRVGTGFAIM